LETPVSGDAPGQTLGRRYRFHGVQRACGLRGLPEPLVKVDQSRSLQVMPTMRLSSPVRLVARLVFIAFLILSVPATALAVL